MNKHEQLYCNQIGRMNLALLDNFSKDFLEKVAGPITDLIFNYITENDSEFSNFCKEVFDEII